MRLRKDNCHTEVARRRLEAIWRRRQILEERFARALSEFADYRFAFPEFDSHDFTAIRHRGYGRVLRELNALQNRLYDCTKFDKLIRYRCANFFF